MDQMIRVAERILSDCFGTQLELQPGQKWEGHKSVALRCRVRRQYGPLPTSVVVKQSKHGAMLEDWAACQFLEQLPNDPPFAPKCYGGDPTTQTIALEDLGDGEGPNTYDLLLGNDPGRASVALLEHMRLMGRLHAASAGRHEAYARARRALGPMLPPKPLYKDPWSTPRGHAITEHERAQAIQDYRSACLLLGLTPAAAAAGEIAWATARVETAPGPFLAFCQGDVNAPGNCVRWKGQLRLYDFDCSGFRHALVEGLAGRLTWGCMSRIPADVVRAMDAAYREELASGCLAARDDRLYRQALVAAAARWHVFHVIWRLPTGLERDYLRGLTSIRQQLLAWLDAFVEIVDEFGLATALGESARAIGCCLRARWPPATTTLPYYPAFRSGKEPVEAA
jgi:hypothetical protein